MLRVGIVIPGKEQIFFIIKGPQAGVGGDGKQAEVDYQGREVIYVIVIVFRRPLGVLVVPVAQFRAGFPSKLGQEYPIVVHQPDIASSQHHDIAVLQVVVSHFLLEQTADCPPPPGCYTLEGIRVVMVSVNEFA